MAPDEDNEQDYRAVNNLSDLDQAAVAKYWGRVHKTLTHVFDKPDEEARDAVADLRRRLNKQPETELHVYHADPFQIAADIARPGIEVTAAEKDRYYEILKEENPDQQDWPNRGSLRRSVPDDPPPTD